MDINWGKKKRAKRILLGGSYYNVPTAHGPMAVQMEVSLVFEARLGARSGDEAAGPEGAWPDVQRELEQRLEAVAERTCEILAQAAPRSASAERICQIELFEGLEPSNGAEVMRYVAKKAEIQSDEVSAVHDVGASTDADGGGVDGNRKQRYSAP